ncbi:MAG: hypothetical protein ACJ8C4_06425 [Gemmataceae bacterium]
MECWRKVWRDGFAPVLSTSGLQALREALMRDDSRLIQGHPTSPPPLQSMLDWPAEGACLLGYSGWQGDGKETVGDVEETIARACFEADQRLGEPASCRWFLNWYDEAPRDEMRREMLSEITRELALRSGDCLADDDCGEGPSIAAHAA